MYNLADPAIPSDGNSYEEFPLGISEGNILDAVTVDKAEEGQGSDYIKFTFKAPNGATVNHFEFPVDESKEDAAKKFESQRKRLKHILSKVLAEGAAMPVGTSFVDLINKIKALCTPHCKSKTFRILTHYNYKNYISIPPFPSFIEPDSVPADKSVLKISKAHKMVADAPAGTNALQQAAQATASTPSDDFPF